MYNRSNNPSAQLIKLAILRKLGYDPYYERQLQRYEEQLANRRYETRRDRLTNIARWLQVAGLGTMIGSLPVQRHNPTLARQMATLGATVTGTGALTNLAAGNVAEALVFGGVPIMAWLLSRRM
jgi:hypothetical protein